MMTLWEFIKMLIGAINERYENFVIRVCDFIDTWSDNLEKFATSKEDDMPYPELHKSDPKPLTWAGIPTEVLRKIRAKWSVILRTGQWNEAFWKECALCEYVRQYRNNNTPHNKPYIVRHCKLCPAFEEQWCTNDKNMSRLHRDHEKHKNDYDWLSAVKQFVDQMTHFIDARERVEQFKKKYPNIQTEHLDHGNTGELIGGVVSKPKHKWTPEQIKAIKDSIEHWERDIVGPLARGLKIYTCPAPEDFRENRLYFTNDMGSTDTNKMFPVPCFSDACPLCQLYVAGSGDVVSLRCINCPLHISGQDCGAPDSAYMAFRQTPTLTTAQRMVDTLKGLLEGQEEEIELHDCGIYKNKENTDSMYIWQHWDGSWMYVTIHGRTRENGRGTSEELKNYLQRNGYTYCPNAKLTTNDHE
jgi:hypothetical protein